MILMVIDRQTLVQIVLLFDIDVSQENNLARCGFFSRSDIERSNKINDVSLNEIVRNL